MDSEGKGLVQTSTAEQQGRKLFVWGMAPGGRRWQDFLTTPGNPYLEIQAGVARTQFESFPMTAGSELSWLEAYGLMEADPAAVHSSDWPTATNEVGSRLETALPAAWMEEKLLQTASLANRQPSEVLHQGSGWGALERRRRERMGEPPFSSEGLVFDDTTLGEEQAPWLSLLEGGILPPRATEVDPGAWMVQPEWREVLVGSLSKPQGENWLSLLHLGTMYYHAGEVDLAQGAWEKSVKINPSPWALRNLAVQAQEAGESDSAADLWVAAYRKAPLEIALAIEALTGLLAAKRPGDADALLREMPSAVRQHGRIVLLEAQVAASLEQLDRAEGLLLKGIEVPDLREGELSLSNLWYEIKAKRVADAENVPLDEELKERVRREYTPPKEIDFRMSEHNSGPRKDVGGE